MSDTGIFWIRDDFRLEDNPALSFTTQNHESVIALFIYNNKNFDNQTEAQKWWVSKSLETFKKDLSKYNINLQIVKGDELDIFSKIKILEDGEGVRSHLEGPVCHSGFSRLN